MTLAKPTLQVHFNKSDGLDNRFAFERNSTATYIDSRGIIKTAVANEPRFNYNPTTGEPLGLLLEPARTNICERSEEFDAAAWVKTQMLAFGSGSVANATVAPDGATTADLLVPNTTAAVHHHVQNNDTAGTYTNGEYVTASVFVKPAGYYRMSILMYYAAGSTGGIGAHFDLATGSWISSQNSPYAYSIVAYPNGWYRVSVTATVTDAVTYPATLMVRVLIRQPTGTITAAWAGDGTNGMYMWGGQLEKGSFPSNYIPTVASAVTKEEDKLRMFDISSWYNPERGTFIGEMQSLLPVDLEGETFHPLVIGDSSGSVLYRIDDATWWGSYDGVTSVGSDIPGPVQNEVFKYGLTYGNSVRDMCINGVPGASGTTSTNNFGKAETGLFFTLGARQGQHIKSLTFIPERVSRQELIKLTQYPADVYVPSFTLNFTGTDVLDSRVDSFTRASIGTIFDKDGYVKEVASGLPRFGYDPVTKESLGLLIEKDKTNFVHYSEHMYGVDAASTTAWTWGTSGGNISALVRAGLNAAEAPDGSYNAIKIISGTDATEKYHAWGKDVSVTERTTAHTFSVFLKAGEYTQAQLIVVAGTMAASGTWVGTAYFDLNAGTVGVTSGTYYLSSGMHAVGDTGWYRCWLTVSQVGATAGAGGCAIMIIPAVGGTTYIIGDGNKGIYSWGGNLQDAGWMTSYIPSATSFTSRASVGKYWGSDGLLKEAAIDVARMSYNPSNLSLPPKLLIEPSRENRVRYSQALASWGTITGVTATNNVAGVDAPDGTTTVASIVEDTGTTGHAIGNAPTTAYTVGVKYTTSVFVKNQSGTRYFGIYIGAAGFSSGNNTGVIFSLQSKSVIYTQGDPVTGNIEDVGNGWFRCSITYTPTLAASAVAYLRMYDTATVLIRTYTGDGTSGFYLWGAQVEPGAGASSYIHTPSTTAVTRSADVSSSTSYTRSMDVVKVTSTNWVSIFNQYEGTFVTKYKIPVPIYNSGISATPFMFSVTDGVDGNDRIAAYDNATNVYFNMKSNNVDVATIFAKPSVTSTPTNIVTSYALNNAMVCQDGVSGTADTSLTLPTSLSTLNIGNQNGDYPLNGYLAQLTYIPKAIPQAQLKKMSTC